jgi:hypothetical protein
VEIQPVAVSGVQRLDEEVPGGDVEDLRLWRGGCGCACCGESELFFLLRFLGWFFGWLR